MDKSESGPSLFEFFLREIGKSLDFSAEYPYHMKASVHNKYG
jgi:hypothetical protein